MAVVQAIVLTLTPDIPSISNTGQYTDIPADHPAEASMLYAARLGIISPDESGRLHPYGTVSRVEFLAMVGRAWALPSNTFSSFKDVPVHSWYAGYAGLAETYKLLDTVSPDTLEPAKPVTMPEVNAALVRLKTVRNVDGSIRIDDRANDPRLLTVVSSRRSRVKLVPASSSSSHSSSTSTTPLVRRTRIPLSLAEQRTTVLRLVNDIRRRYGLTELVLDERLQQSAQLYANRMVEEGFFAHVSPDGLTLRDRMAATGFYDRTFQKDCNCIKGYALGENLAKGQTTPEQAVRDWMDSPEHRAAILNPAYHLSGVGINAGIWVQHFGAVTVPD